MLSSPNCTRVLCFLMVLTAIGAGPFLPAKAIAQESEAKLPTSIEDQIAHFARQGTSLYQQKKYAQSQASYVKAMELGSKDMTVAFNAACCAALVGESEPAFVLLQTSLEFGWRDSRKLQSDTDLNSLHSDKRWKELLTQCQQLARSEQNRWNSKALATPYAENISAAEKAAGLSKLWAEVKFNFVNFEHVSELDWDEEYFTAMPEVLESKSTLEYYQILQRLVAKLNDGHTNVNLPLQLKSQESLVGIETRLVEDKVIILSVSDRTAAKSGVKTGMEILKVNGLDVKTHAAKNIAPFVCASTLQDRNSDTFGRSLLTGPSNQAIELQLVDKNGETTTHSINRLSSFQSGLRWLSKPSVKLQIMENNIGYVALNTFATNAVSNQFANLFEDVNQTDALILDLRRNSGGNSGVGWEIVGHLTNKPFPTTRWHMLQYRPTNRAWGRQSTFKFGKRNDLFSRVQSDCYSKPVVLLVGPRTYSAAEDMAAAFDMLNRGKIIGEPTGGSTGQPLSFTLPGGGSARVCTKRDSYADGTEFVGVGIQPDIVVKPTVEDIRNGDDTVLIAAKRFLTSMKKE